MEEKLAREYDSIFEGDEAVDMFLKLTSDSFTRKVERIKLSEIGYTQPIKLGRQDTVMGLTSSTKDLGVVSPIHVMTVEEESESEDYKYILIDGLRRVYGALKNGMTEIDAVVWDFKDKERGMELALVISLILNRQQRHSWREKWDTYRILEMQHSTITPGVLEYLLQLEGGDAMKLKDVMLCEYEEVKQALINDEKTLDGAYKMLQKLRKEEDALYRDDTRGIKDIVEDAEDITGDNSDGGSLSDDDVRELLEMSESMDEDDISSDDFGELNQSEFADEKQKVGERHPVDPAIRQGTFQRDNYECRRCGTGGVAFLATLVYHHLIPVHCGGADTVENGLTLCDSCHQTLHCSEKAGGKIPMTEEQFKEYDEDEQKRIKLIIKYSKIAVEAAKRQGVNQERIKEEANKSARHRMPGETLKETQAGYLNAQRG